MTTTIISNGSKWAGEPPDDIETLLRVLQGYVLGRIHEPFYETAAPGDRWAAPGTTRFSGNFLELSHVFSIDTDEPELIARLRAAIDANTSQPDFQSQPSREQRRQADEEYRLARDRVKQAARERAARATLGLAVQS